MRLLDLLPRGDLAFWVIGAALAAAAGFGAVQTLRLAQARAALAEEQRDHAATVAKLQQAAREQAEQMRATEREWRAAQHENAVIARKAREQAAADAAAADAAAGRLRDRFTALAATCHSAAGDSAAVSAGPAAGTPADLLADVLGRMDQAARRIAAYADAASISGEQCAADYQALKGDKRPAETGPFRP